MDVRKFVKVKMDTSHVVYNTASDSMICKNCGAVETLSVGAIIKKFGKRAGTFLDRHRLCRGARRGH